MHPDYEYSILSGVRGCILNQFRRLVVYGKDRIKRWQNKKLARTNLSSHQLQTEVFIHVTAALKRGRGVGRGVAQSPIYYSRCFNFYKSNSFQIIPVQFDEFHLIFFQFGSQMVFYVLSHIETIKLDSFQFFLQEILSSALCNIGRIVQNQFQTLNSHV